MERIRQNGSWYGGTQLLAFNPLPNVTRCVLLRFEQKDIHWLYDFTSHQELQKFVNHSLTVPARQSFR